MEGRRASLQKFATEAKLAFEESLGLLLQPAPSAHHRPARSELLDSLTRLEKRATEVALVWADRPKLEEGLLALRSFSSEAAICLLLHSGMSAGAGPTLLRSMQQAAAGLTSSALALTQGVLLWDAQESPGSKRQSSLPPLAGRMHDAIETMKKAPSGNKEAVGREVVQCTRSVRDVVREMGEMRGSEAEEVVETGVTSQPMPSIVDSVAALSLKREEGEGGDAGGGEEVEERNGKGENRGELIAAAEEEEEEEEEEESEEEGQQFDFEGDDVIVVGAACDVCRGVQAVLKELIYTVAALKVATSTKVKKERPRGVETALLPAVSTSSGSNSRGSKGSAEIVSQLSTEGDALECLLDLCKTLSLEVDEIGASLYPPQEYKRLLQGGNEIGRVVDGIRVWVRDWAVEEGGSLSMALQACENARVPFVAQIEHVMS